MTNTVRDHLTEQFYAWELRGRGLMGADVPVELEPPFRPFYGFVKPQIDDDGRRPGLFSRLFGRDQRPEAEELPEEPPLSPFESGENLVEYALSVPPQCPVGMAASEGWLTSLVSCRLPVAFEIVGTGERLEYHLSCHRGDAPLVESQVRTFFPDVALASDPGHLRERFEEGGDGVAGMLQFCLAREFMLPLARPRSFDPDPLLPMLAVLSSLQPGEAGMLQVLIAPTRERWGESAIRIITNTDGKPFFEDAPEITKLGLQKLSRPLFAVALRIAAKSSDAERTWRILTDLSAALMAFGSPEGNELAPLSAVSGAEDDLFRRESKWSGMLLSVEELLGLVHLPGPSVRLPKLRRRALRTKVAPAALQGGGVLLGCNRHEGERRELRLPEEARLRHVHVIGASGTGKSTLLSRMILEDIEAGRGLALIDPHGDLVDELAARIPPERLADVVLLDPADQSFSVGLNVLEARSEIGKELLASDLVAVFRRLSTSWGDQMTSVLGNAVAAFLESREGGTLLELRRFLVDADFRRQFLKTVADPDVRGYWEREFAIVGTKSLGPILTRLDTFLRPKLVRRMVAARAGVLNVRDALDSGAIVLAKLAQGAIGEENAALLGSILVSAFHQAAQSRQELAPEDRRFFALYIDEVQEVATPSMAALLSGIRKYRLSVTAAHQTLGQLKHRAPELSEALLGNAGTRIIFRVGEEDARALERGLSHFSAADLGNLAVGEAVVRFERSEGDCNLETAVLPALERVEARENRHVLLAFMRALYPVPEPGAADPEVVPEVQGKPQATEVPPDLHVADEVVAGPADQAPVPAEAPASPEPAPTPMPIPTAAPFPRALPPAPQEPSAVTQPETASPVPKPKRVRAAAGEPATIGRGGPEHRYHQELIKRWGESRGFAVTLEAPVEGGSVDVALVREGLRIACEISVTSTAEQEVGNIRKCLAAGFDEVLVVSMRKAALGKFQKAVEKEIPATERHRVHLMGPEDLLGFLDSRRSPGAAPTVGGRRVTIRRSALEGEEGKRRARAVGEVLARARKRINRKGE